MDLLQKIQTLRTAIHERRTEAMQQLGTPTPRGRLLLEAEIRHLERALERNTTTSSLMPFDTFALQQVARPILFERLAQNFSDDPQALDAEARKLFAHFRQTIADCAEDLEKAAEHNTLIPIQSVTTGDLVSKYGTPPRFEAGTDNNIQVENTTWYGHCASPAYDPPTYTKFHELTITDTTKQIDITICAYNPELSDEKTLHFRFVSPRESVIPSVTLGLPFDDYVPRHREIAYEGTARNAIVTVLHWSNISNADALISAVDALFISTPPPPKRARVYEQ